MLSLTGCGGCDIVLVKVFTRLGIEPDYHKMIVEAASLPKRIDVLLVTGCVATPEEGLLLAEASRRASRIILVGCCALRGLLMPRRRPASTCCKPPRMMVEHPRVTSIPGCPALEPLVERILAHAAF